MVLTSKPAGKMKGHRMTAVIDTPSGIEKFRMISAIQALRVEMRGMKMTRGFHALKFVKETYGVTAGTKAKAFEQMLELYEETYGEPYGGAR